MKPKFRDYAIGALALVLAGAGIRYGCSCGEKPETEKASVVASYNLPEGIERFLLPESEGLRLVEFGPIDKGGYSAKYAYDVYDVNGKEFNAHLFLFGKENPNDITSLRRVSGHPRYGPWVVLDSQDYVMLFHSYFTELSDGDERIHFIPIIDFGNLEEIVKKHEQSVEALKSKIPQAKVLGEENFSEWWKDFRH
jgi:hypothetical protein